MADSLDWYSFIKIQHNSLSWSIFLPLGFVKFHRVSPNPEDPVVWFCKMLKNDWGFGWWWPWQTMKIWHTYPMTDPYVCHIWCAIYHQYPPVMLASIYHTYGSVMGTDPSWGTDPKKNPPGTGPRRSGSPRWTRTRRAFERPRTRLAARSGKTREKRGEMVTFKGRHGKTMWNI